MSITVVPAYRVVKKFVRDVEAMPIDAALDSLWSNLRTYVRHLLAGVEPALADIGQRTAVAQIGDPDLAALTEAMDALEEAKVRTLAEQALQQCAAALPRPDLAARVLLLPGDGQSRVLTCHLHGILGMSLGAQATLVFLWPTEAWKVRLPYTIAHEYVHLVRNLLFPRWATGGRMVFQKSQEPETLLDAMVTEGIADAFARSLYPEVEPPGLGALREEDLRDVWPKVRRRLDTPDMAEIRRFLYGDNDRIPVWVGFALGYRIVSRYLAEHTGVRPANLVGMPAAALFDASNFAPEPASV